MRLGIERTWKCCYSAVQLVEEIWFWIAEEKGMRVMVASLSVGCRVERKSVTSGGSEIQFRNFVVVGTWEGRLKFKGNFK